MQFYLIVGTVAAALILNKTTNDFVEFSVVAGIMSMLQAPRQKAFVKSWAGHFITGELFSTQ